MVIINPTGKSDKNQNDKEHKNKYLIDEVLEKFNQTLIIHIIKNKEAFLLHHILGYLKELSDDYGIKAILTYTVSLKK